MSVLDAIGRFPAWIEQHPVVFSLIVSAFVSIANAIWAPRTAEQYAAMPPRLAAFFKVLTAVFPNPAKALEGLAQVRSGTVIPVAVVREAQRAAHASELADIVASSPLGVTVVTMPAIPVEVSTRSDDTTTPVTPIPVTVRERASQEPKP